jgi:hypothetical protein
VSSPELATGTLRVVDSPSGDRVVVLPVSGRPGVPGPPGAAADVAGQLRATAPAGADLSGHRLVTPQADGTLRYLSNADAADLGAPCWLTVGSALAGTDAVVLVYGAITEPSWSWTSGPLYLGADGLLTQTPPTAPSAAFIVSVGYATAPTSIFLSPQPAISLI